MRVINTKNLGLNAGSFVRKETKSHPCLPPCDNLYYLSVKTHAQGDHHQTQALDHGTKTCFKLSLISLYNYQFGVFCNSKKNGLISHKMF